MLKGIGSWILDIIIILIVVYLITTFVGQRTSVIGDSMKPTLQNGNQVIIDKLSYRFTEPKRFDVIVFPYKMNPNQLYIKRVIGLPGETIQLVNGEIYIDGAVLEEDYGLEVFLNAGIGTDPVVIADGEYFVLGDNRNNSSDSRFVDVGNVPKGDIVGRAWIKIWPLKDFGLLKHD
ncbi:signal peptidase I [Natranaerovirga pectinivora]|uniref:Signal peptidase I n=1 Tax=Natranaerovirga pectinivora TaxID=682400 RepID=A0A4R3MP33_9FIRM|nr:signal peptidase I [Natranaerovirga pectinivora]TCT16981.1 signal peptidase I [Natranaerovirga pectinivora]